MELSPQAAHEADRREAARYKRLAEAHKVAAPERQEVQRPPTQDCTTCGATFKPRVVELLGKEIFRQLVCRACNDAQEAAKAAQHASEYQDRANAREALWRAFCPWSYRLLVEDGETDPVRLARDCPNVEDVRSFDLGRKGLLIKGETNHGKTRAAWRLMRRLFDEKLTLRAFTAGEFGRDYADACGASGNYTRTPWFNGLATADVVLLDDLGKGEWTAGAWAECFDLIESRMKHGRPTIITTNEVGETLQAKGKDANTVIPFLRRLREFHQLTL